MQRTQLLWEIKKHKKDLTLIALGITSIPASWIITTSLGFPGIWGIIGIGTILLITLNEIQWTKEKHAGYNRL